MPSLGQAQDVGNLKRLGSDSRDALNTHAGHPRLSSSEIRAAKLGTAVSGCCGTLPRLGVACSLRQLGERGLATPLSVNDVPWSVVVNEGTIIAAGNALCAIS